MKVERSYYGWSSRSLPGLLHDVNNSVESQPGARLVGVCYAEGLFYAIMEEEKFVEEEKKGGPLASKS